MRDILNGAHFFAARRRDAQAPTRQATPRAIETAIAMGFAVDDTIELPSGYVPGEVDHHDQWHWPRPYRTYAELIARPSGLAAVAEARRFAWTDVVEAVPDDAGLVVGHGGGSGSASTQREQARFIWSRAD